MAIHNIQKQTFYNIRLEFLVCFFLVVITVAAYWQVRHHEFTILDDEGYVSQNSYVRSGINRQSIRWAFSFNKLVYWHPVTWLSHMLDTQLYGLNPGMHHRTNLIFHIASSLALFLIFRLATGSLWKSAFIGALFAIHPMNVESVAWIAERKNVLSTFFWMLTLMAYVVYANRPGYFWYLTVLIAFTLGLMAKPMLVTLPFVLLLMDYWPLNRFRPDTGSLVRPSLFLLFIEKIPFLVLSAISVLLSSLSLQRLGIVVSTEITPLKFRVANALTSYVKYIGKMLWPANLAVFYPYPSSVPVWETFAAFLILLGMSFLLVRTLRSMPALGIGWLWYLGTLIPVIGLFQAGLWPAMADRWAYVPFIGLFVIIAWGIPEMLTGWRYKVAGLSIMATVVLSILLAITWMQVRGWRDSVALFAHAVDVHPTSQMAHYNLGVAYEKEGRITEAIAHYKEALRINPRYAKPRNNLALLLSEQGRPDEAIGQFVEALRANPDNADVHNNLGAAFLKQGRLSEAVQHFSEALNLDPDHADAHNNLGVALAVQENTVEAIKHFQEALRVNPHHEDARNNLTRMSRLERIGNPDLSGNKKVINHKEHEDHKE